jgi:hypothetical protein
MTGKATMIDLMLYEAAEADFKLKLAKLREFYDAATARRVTLAAEHSIGCPGWNGEGACHCGGDGRQARIDKALAALADDAEGDAG